MNNCLQNRTSNVRLQCELPHIKYLKLEMSENISHESFHLGRPRVMEYEKQFSVHVSQALDILGKSQEMIKFRVESYTEQERCRNNIGRNLIRFIFAGSKGEGLTAPFENDLDLMSVTYTVICADNTVPLRSLPAQYTVLKSDRRNTSPGYTKLMLDQTRSRTVRTHLDNSLIDDGYGNLYLSSDCYFEYCEHQLPSTHSLIQNIDRRGPSMQSEGPFSQDFVLAFPCLIPEITRSFIERNRYYGWPTNDQLTEIATLEGHVVPVGYKGSQTAFLEWRICYTKTELLLMRSLSDTQTKTYILLKMVAKTYIKLVCKEITSYVLKNIVLWQAECVNCDTLNEEFLVNSLIQALFFLRNCIINNSLPSYMIPERNLLSEKLDLGQKQTLVILLTELINKGGGLLMGCERLRGTMFVLYKAPAVAEQYRWKRDMIEKLYLLRNNIVSEKQSTGATDEQVGRFTDEAYFTITKTMHDLIIPDRMSLMLQGHDALSISCIFQERLKQWLS